MAATTPGGVLTQPGNIGNFSQTRFAAVPEVSLKAGYQMVTGPFANMIADGWKPEVVNYKLVAQGLLNAGFTLLVIGSMIIILAQALTRWLAPAPGPPAKVEAR